MNSNNDWIGPLIGASFLVLIVLAIVTTTRAKSPARFKKGDPVEIKLTGEIGTVLSADYHREWRYSVRVAQPIQKTRDGILSRDSIIARYSVVRFLQFELRGAP